MGSIYLLILLGKKFAIYSFVLYIRCSLNGRVFKKGCRLTLLLFSYLENSKSVACLIAVCKCDMHAAGKCLIYKY